MLKFKIDVLEELKKAGFNTAKIRSEKTFSETTLQGFRRGKVPSAESINRLCEILKKQPGKILEWIPDQQEQEEKETE